MLTVFLKQLYTIQNDSCFVLLGGVICKHEAEERLIDMNNQLQAVYTKIFGIDYKNKLVNRAISVNNEMKKILNHSSPFQELIMPFYIIRKLDHQASYSIELYLEMLNEYIPQFLFHYNDTLLEHAKIRFVFAIESAFPGLDVIATRINDALTVFPNLKGIRIKISITLLAMEIDYTDSYIKQASTSLQNLFFLADWFCHYVVNQTVAHKNAVVSRAIALQFDNITNYFKKLGKYYFDKNVLAFMKLKYEILNRYQNHMFISHIRSAIDYFVLSEMISSKTAVAILYYVKGLTATNEWTIQEKLNLLYQIQCYLPQFKGDDQLIYHELFMEAYQIQGEYEQATNHYHQALNVMSEMDSFDYIPKQSLLMMRYAEVCAAQFDYHNAIEISDTVIECAEYMASLTHDPEFGQVKEVFTSFLEENLVRIYGAKARYLSFLGREEAYFYYQKALGLLEGWREERKVLVSSMIHFFAESNVLLTSDEQMLIKEYLHGNDFYKQLDYFLKAVNLEDIAFELYAFVKLYRFRYTNQIDHFRLKKLVSKISVNLEQLKGYPWPQILFNLAQIYEPMDRKTFTYVLQDAIEMCDNSPNQHVDKVFGKMINVYLHQEKSAILEFYQCIKDTNNILFEYFETDNQLNKSVQDQVEHILGKFTFMNH